MKKSLVLCSILALVGYMVVFKSDLSGDIYMNGVPTYESGETYERMNKAYEALPDKVKYFIEKEGYRFYVVDMIDNDECIVGQTVFIQRLILIKNTRSYIEQTTFHECGHVLDDELAYSFISNSNEFLRIYAEEKGNFKVGHNYDYFVSTPQEYFASAFAEYMMHPIRLRRFTPRTYKFIEQCLK